jgi:type IV secretion system protein VirB9
MIAVLILAVPAAGVSQVQPLPGAGDPRLQIVDYSEGSIVQLRGAPGYQLMVELSPDEQVQNVAVGDSTAWQISVSKTGDRLFLKPVQPDSATNMTVVTSVRQYSFDLFAFAQPTGDMPYTVRFRYPAVGPSPDRKDAEYVDVSSALRRNSHYRISGDRLLRPSSVTDDGDHTYIKWPRRSAVPAVYAIDRNGNEILANGMMRPDDVYVVDGVPGKLTFRIDRSVARAETVRPRKGR